MGSKYVKIAGELQSSVIANERDGISQYDEEQTKVAIVHTRQDVVLLVSHLSSLNQQAATIRRLLWAAVIMLFIIYTSLYS
jgi:hypothetical protein